MEKKLTEQYSSQSLQNKLGTKVKHTEGLMLLDKLYEHLIKLQLFNSDNIPNTYLFANRIAGKSRAKYGRKGYVRRRFVEIGCLSLSEFEGAVNVNIQDEDIIWVEEVSEYLKNYIDYSVINGYMFSFLFKLPMRASSTLHLHNLRFSVIKTKYNVSNRRSKTV